MKDIELFIENKQIIYGVITTVDNTAWDEYGNKQKLKWSGIVDQYINSPESVPQLLAMLDGKTLPQTVRQGEVIGIFGKIPSGLLYAFFIHDSSDIITRRRRATQINIEVIELLNKR